MPQYANEQEAAAALEAAGLEDEATNNPDPPQADEPPAPEPDESPADEADQEDATHKAMLETLPPEARSYLEAREKEQQADYTRKTMALAEQRKAAEADLAFLDRIRSDPYAALEFHDELTKALIAAGLPPDAAAAMADEAGTGPTPSAPAPTPGVTDLDLDDPVQAELAALRGEWSQFKQAQADAESKAQAAAEQAEVDALASKLQQQEMLIRQENPKYKDDDIERIYALAFAPKYGGDLDKAHEAYQGMKNEWAAEYMNAKSAAAEHTEPRAGAIAQTPRKFATLDEAAAAAEEYLRNALADQ